jgi:anti-anti-sigma factor
VVALKGRMDGETFQHTVADQISGGACRFVVDCAALEYISSAGLRSLLLTAKSVRSRNGELVFSGLTGLVREVFDIAGFTAMFSVYDSTDAALQRW